jgi:thiosulfate reductase cytochrome b subunit
MQASVTILLIVAVIAANLPFVLTRIGGLVPVAHKHFFWRLLEFGLLYLLVGLFARLLESRLMPVHQQDWQFYVSTLALFVVFAFPGFVWRYFWRQHD